MCVLLTTSTLHQPSHCLFAAHTGLVVVSNLEVANFDSGLKIIYTVMVEGKQAEYVHVELITSAKEESSVRAEGALLYPNLFRAFPFAN